MGCAIPVSSQGRLLLESWPALLGLLQHREVSKILPLSYFTQPHGVRDKIDSSLPQMHFSLQKQTSSAGAKVGNKILYSAEFKRSFPLLVSLQAPSLFMGPRQDLGHRKEGSEPAELCRPLWVPPSPVFSAKGTKAELP